MLLHNQIVISGSGDGTARKWDLKNGNEVNNIILPTTEDKPFSQPLLFDQNNILFSRFDFFCFEI